MTINARDWFTDSRNRSVRRGATIVLMVFLVPALAALAINAAYIESVNQDLQVVADLACREATRVYAQTGDKDLALNAARDAASRNLVGGVVLPIAMSDLEFGISQRGIDGQYSFEPADTGNSVRLTTTSYGQGVDGGLPMLIPIAGPSVRIRSTRRTVGTEGVIDIALVLDRSGSMAYAADEIPVAGTSPSAAPQGWTFGHPAPNQARWRDLSEAVDTFIEELDLTVAEEKVALSTYADTSATNTPLTFDYQTIHDQIDGISDSFHGGFTNIHDGLLEGVYAVHDPQLARDYTMKLVVLMTDGNRTAGDNPLRAANVAAARGVKVFTITFGDDADQATMGQIASRCAGVHLHADDSSQLREAFRTVARQLPAMWTQ